jgi:hypothetical protein
MSLIDDAGCLKKIFNAQFAIFNFQVKIWLSIEYFLKHTLNSESVNGELQQVKGRN